MKKNKLTICLSLLAVTASLFALLCSQFGCKKSENTDKTERPTVTVTLSPERVSVAEYESVRLVAEVEGSDETVVWSSSDLFVATVDNDGVVYGVKSGNCDIVASVGKYNAKCALTVTETSYAPSIKVIDKITVEKGKSYTGDVGVFFKGEDVTGKAETKWTAEDGSEEICRVETNAEKFTFYGKNIGTAKYFVGATYNGIYVSKGVTINVIDPIASVVPDGNVTVGDYGYEIKLCTVAEAGVTEMPLTFTVYQGENVVKNAVIEWDLDSDEYDEFVAEISGENGNYLVRKVAAGETTIVGTYTAPNGKKSEIAIKVTVEKAVKLLDIRPVIEVENLQPITLPESFTGVIDAVTMGGENILSSASAKTVNFNKIKLPKTAGELGEREIVVSTADIDYKFTAEIYSLIISDKAEFDKMRDIARANGGNAGNSLTGVSDGYFILDNDVDYGGEYLPITDSGELWRVDNTGWNNPSVYGFKGVFDGRGYTVDGLTAKARSGEHESGGIFGYLGKSGVVRNVSFTNAAVYENSGFICSFGGGLIENVSVTFARIGVGNTNRYLFEDAGDPRTMGAFFSCGADDGARVKNCFVDAIGADIRYAVNKNRSDLANVRLGTRAKNVENLVVLSDHSSGEKILAESGSVYTATSYSQLSSSVTVKGAIDEFGEEWTIIGGIPFLNSLASRVRRTKIDFVGLSELLATGSSLAIKTNTPYCEILVEGLYDGVTYENGVITVDENAGSGVITVTVISLIDGSRKSEEINVAQTREVAVTHERKLVETSETTIDLSFANEYIGEKAKISSGEIVLGDGAVTDGKLSVDLTKTSELGELTLTVFSLKGQIYYSFELNVVLATKVIRADKDWSSVHAVPATTAAKESIYGYFVLANDIDFGGATFNETCTLGSYWENGFGFRGTFDGRNHTISNVKVGQGGLFGFVGKGAVIKDVKFDKVDYIGAYRGSLLGTSVNGATLSNIDVKVSSYVNLDKDPPFNQGFLSSRWMSGCALTNVKIDASECDVYSVFGYTVNNNSCTGVEIKVKSYTIIGFVADGVSEADRVQKIDGVEIKVV